MLPHFYSTPPSAYVSSLLPCMLSLYLYSSKKLLHMFSTLGLRSRTTPTNTSLLSLPRRLFAY
ncbi:hypothetical protein FIBSPDRAFT_284448 [Athelia psychrophila]|uniref:Uncharacterized protein n=1 Tax=Athelia psychrophila TaxID=1759441 RepID=A0A166R5J5_9AGAM|nr:hypothetical protein FIBSPDRAFT_284448 [Fibularhizoctonia sp. CBS 109695]